MSKNSKKIMSWCVKKLSEKYGFVEEEALEYLEGCEMKKEKAAKREVPEFPLPYCGEVCEEWCKAVKYNRGLMTQCTNKYKSGEMYCTTCAKSLDSETGKPAFGVITERGEEDWKSPGGKYPVKYANVMPKLKYKNEPLTQEMVELEVAKLGWTVPSDQFIPSPKGRVAKKAKSTTNEDAPKKRGRPVKSKPVTAGETGDDLIASLVAQAKLQEPAKEPAKEPAAEEPAPEAAEESAPEAAEEPAPEAAEEPAKEPAKEPAAKPAPEAVAEPVAEPAATESVVENEISDKVKHAKHKVQEFVKDFHKTDSPASDGAASSDEEGKKKKTKEAKAAEKAAEKAAAKEAKAAEKQAHKEAKANATQAAVGLATKKAERLAERKVEKSVANEEELVEESEEEEEDSVSVMQFNYEGKLYLREIDGDQVYDNETQEEVGTWDGSQIQFEK